MLEIINRHGGVETYNFTGSLAKLFNDYTILEGDTITLDGLAYKVERITNIPVSLTFKAGNKAFSYSACYELKAIYGSHKNAYIARYWDDKNKYKKVNKIDVSRLLKSVAIETMKK